MALFGSKKNNEGKAAPKKPQKAAAPKARAKKMAAPEARMPSRDLAAVLRRPRITEKAVAANERGVYVFEIDPRADKRAVATAVEALFGVVPQKVRTVTAATRQVMSRTRGRRVREAGIKKAYVYLKKGDSINLM